MNLRNKIIKLAYENPNLRDQLLPLVVDSDLPGIKVANMNREAWVLKGILSQFGRILPRAAKVKMKETAKRLRATKNPKSVYQWLIGQINTLGRKLGISSLGSAVDRFGRSISLSKLWNLVKSYVSGGYEAVLKIFGITPAAATAQAIRLGSTEKEAVAALAVIGGSIAILIIVALLLLYLSQSGDTYVDAIIDMHVIEGAFEAIAAILDAIGDS